MWSTESTSDRTIHIAFIGKRSSWIVSIVALEAPVCTMDSHRLSKAAGGRTFELKLTLMCANGERLI